MMRKKYKLLICLFLVICASACLSEPYEEKIDNITKVFYHETGEYSFLVQPDNSNISKTIRVGCHVISDDVTYVRDVPTNKKMWAIYSGYRDWDNACFIKKIVIHVHTDEDIYGAGWNHGKHGLGTTSVIE